MNKLIFSLLYLLVLLFSFHLISPAPLKHLFNKKLNSFHDEETVQLVPSEKVAKAFIPPEHRLSLSRTLKHCLNNCSPMTILYEQQTYWRIKGRRLQKSSWCQYRNSKRASQRTAQRPYHGRKCFTCVASKIYIAELNIVTARHQ